jgi:hypothetical protein
MDYVCPKCDYRTELKYIMKRHFGRKRPCPNKNNVELTGDIINTVLANRVYYPPKKDPISQIVNNHNMINNFLYKIDDITKINSVLEYENKKLLPFEEQIEQQFELRTRRLANNLYKTPYNLTEDGIIELINAITIIDPDQIDRLNLLFDKKLNRLKIYKEEEWKTLMVEMGIRDLVSLFKSYFLDTYELYLIKNLHSEGSVFPNRYPFQEHIDIYYRFIATFDLTPAISNTSDHDLLGHRLVDGNDYYLEETYTKKYGDIKSNLKNSEKAGLKKKILNVVKENSIHNLNELNKQISEILKINGSFRHQLLESVSSTS